MRLPRRLRLALIGLQGHVNEVVGSLPQLPDVEVVAVQEPDAGDLAKFVKRYPRAKVYTDYRKMLDEQHPDLVSVCPPNGTRHEAVIECLERNVDFIAEKPLATERQGFEKIVRLAGTSKSRIGMLLPMRYDPEYRALRQVVASGVIGEVAQISSQKSYKAGVRPAWMKDPHGYGSTITWIGIHMVDLMRWTSGREFIEAFSLEDQVGAPPGIGKMENTTGSVFRLDNRGVATLHMDYYRPESAPTHGDDRLRLAGTKGVAEYQAATGVTVITEGKGPAKITELPPKGSVFLDYLDYAFNGKAPTLPVADILQVNRIVIAAEESVARGSAVKI